MMMTTATSTVIATGNATNWIGTQASEGRGANQDFTTGRVGVCAATVFGLISVRRSSLGRRRPRPAAQKSFDGPQAAFLPSAKVKYLGLNPARE